MGTSLDPNYGHESRCILDDSLCYNRHESRGILGTSQDPNEGHESRGILGVSLGPNSGPEKLIVARWKGKYRESDQVFFL